MTGLENILLQIKSEAEAKAAKAIYSAKCDAEKYVNEAVYKAEKISNEYRALGEKSAAELISRTKTAGEVKLSRTRLLKKQEIIKDIIENAKIKIKEQKTDDYFKFLDGLLQKYALNEDGIILMAAEDKEEVTDSFNIAIKKYRLKALPGDIPKREGFVLVYGSIEINCTITAVFEAASEEISDMLNDFLFGCEGGC